MTENNVAEPLLIGEAVIVTRNRELMSATVHDEIVMMDIDSGRYYGLDDIGSVIWRRVESPQTSARSSIAWWRSTMPTAA